MLLRLFTLLLLATSFLSAQDLANYPSPHEPAFNGYFLNSDNRPVLSGRVINMPPDLKRDSLIMYAAVTILRDDQEQLYLTPAADGTFSVVLPGSHPIQEIWFGFGDHFYGTAFLRDELSIEFDYAALAATQNNQWVHPGVTFGGADKTLATFRALQVEAKLKNTHNYMDVSMNRSMETPDKHMAMDSVLRALRDMDNKVLADAPDDVAEILKNNRTTEFFGRLCVVYWNDEMSDGLLQAYRMHRPVVVSNSTRDFYQYFTVGIKAAGGRKTRASMEGKTGPADWARPSLNYFLKYVDENFSPARADLLKLYYQEKDPLVRAAYTQKALASMTTPWAKQRLQARFDIDEVATSKLRESLNRRVDILEAKDLGKAYGSLPFGADLYVVGNEVTGEDLLDKLRGAFAGKALYLDFWATWCAPCLGEMPHSAKLHGEAKGLPLEFIYLCTDSGGSEEKWRNIIASKQVGGTHVYIPNKAHNKLLKLFEGRGFPTYVLLRADGTNKLDVKRPSGLNRKELERLLNR